METKILSMFILSVFLVSLFSFAAFADLEGTLNTDVSADTNVNTGLATARTDINVQADVETSVNNDRADRKAERMERRNDVKEVRQERKDLRNDIKTARQVIVDSKVRLLDCRSKFDIGCKKVRDDYRKDAVQFLLGAADRMINYLESVKVKVSNSNAENKAELTANIDAEIKQINDIKLEIEAFGETPSKEDVKGAAEKLRVEFKNVKKHTSRAAIFALSNRMGGVIEKMNHLNERLDNVLLKLKADGQNTASLDAKVADFKAAMSESTRLYNEASLKLKSGAEPNEVHELIKQSHVKLKEAHSILKEIVKEVKSLNDGAKVLAETETKASTSAQVNDVSANVQSSLNSDAQLTTGNVVTNLQGTANAEA